MRDTRRCFKGSPFPLTPLLLPLPSLFLSLFPLWLPSLLPLWVPRNDSALLSDRRWQESQTRARNHVLAALDSTCHEPPCTPDRLRTSSCQHCTLFLHERIKSVGVQHVPVDPVRLSSQEGFQVNFLYPLIELFGSVLLPRGEGFVPIVVLVAIFSREGFFSSQGSCV